MNFESQNSFDDVTVRTIRSRRARWSVGKTTCWIFLLVCIPLTAVWFWQSRTPSNDIHLAELIAERERDSYQIVKNSEDTLIHALFVGAIRPGIGIESLLSEIPPVWTETYGKYVVYGFDERGYSWRTLITYNDKLVRASAGSCTWDWTFFDLIPAADFSAISHTSFLREYAAKHPEYEPKMRDLVHENLRLLDRQE